MFLQLAPKATEKKDHEISMISCQRSADHSNRGIDRRARLGDLGQIKSASNQNNPPSTSVFFAKPFLAAFDSHCCWRRGDATSWNLTCDRLLEMGGHWLLHTAREPRPKMALHWTYSALGRVQEPAIQTLCSLAIEGIRELLETRPPCARAIMAREWKTFVNSVAPFKRVRE